MGATFLWPADRGMYLGTYQRRGYNKKGIVCPVFLQEMHWQRVGTLSHNDAKYLAACSNGGLRFSKFHGREGLVEEEGVKLF